jgi:hypothetical protein
MFPLRVTTDRAGVCRLPVYPGLPFTISWVMFGAESQHRQDQIGLEGMPPKLDLIVRRR